MRGTIKVEVVLGNDFLSQTVALTVNTEMMQYRGKEYITGFTESLLKTLKMTKTKFCYVEYYVFDIEKSKWQDTGRTTFIYKVGTAFEMRGHAKGNQVIYSSFEDAISQKIEEITEIANSYAEEELS